jgi:hypothetical protein
MTDDIKHAYLQTGSGQPLTFLRLAGEECPLCSKGAQGTPLAILFEAHDKETVHCTKCDYQLTRPPQGTYRFRPMNSGGR